MTESLTKTLFEEIVQSDLFTFYVGDNKTPFTVHTKAVAATSRVFDSLLNGGMSEAQSRSAELENVDPATFVRFLEYAYRHDYTDPFCVQDLPSNENGVKDPGVFVVPPTQQATQVPPVATSNWANSRSAPSAFGALPSVKKPERQSKNPVGSRAAFNRREYANPSQISLPPRADNDARPLSPSLSFAPLFLAHARLYTLADMRMVDPLKELALYKLHKTLVRFELHPERLGDVVELARYAYEHGEDRSGDGKVDALRDMVVNYIACEMKVLGKHPGFRNLMDSGGEFAGDFWNIVSQELF
ncbi:hypothetical protein OPT61_g6874 [Boeremia exigua]|uniref:Uncharacterized protein n=1 Tax=Boeremia exigua TaxID=749465 RepID=A0ACC2I4D0_9PLEO|nr:hypothetical protein OPT61_g6874 [Boeremia exigua]